MDPSLLNAELSSFSAEFLLFFGSACAGALVVGLFLGSVFLFVTRDSVNISDTLEAQFNWIPALIVLLGVANSVDLDGWVAFAAAFVFGLAAGLLSWFSQIAEWVWGVTGLLLSIGAIADFYGSQSNNKWVMTSALLTFAVCLAALVLVYFASASSAAFLSFAFRFTPLSFVALFGMVETIQFLVSPFGLDNILAQTIGSEPSAAFLTVGVVVLAACAAFRPDFTSTIAAMTMLSATVFFNIALWFETENYGPTSGYIVDGRFLIAVVGGILGYSLMRIPGATFGGFHSNKALRSR